jgi:hypothetical protein|tara:strand:+ start:848 stop:1042 length:195 start_codon:yes stop_codon:yes gene_type:complete
MTGIEAKVYVAGVQDPGDIVFRFDESLDMRVENLFESELGTNIVEDSKHLRHVGGFVCIEPSGD